MQSAGEGLRFEPSRGPIEEQKVQMITRASLNLVRASEDYRHATVGGSGSACHLTTLRSGCLPEGLRAKSLFKAYDMFATHSCSCTPQS